MQTFASRHGDHEDEGQSSQHQSASGEAVHGAVLGMPLRDRHHAMIAVDAENHVAKR